MPKTIVKLKRPAIRIGDAKDPRAWRTVGTRLLDGARVVWRPLDDALQGFKRTAGRRTETERREFSRQAEYFGPFFVLAGLAVENHLKARIPERRLAAGLPVPDGTAVVNLFPRKHHDLILLAHAAGVVLTPGTRALLERLSAFALWAGRYPIPKKAADAVFERTTRETDLREIEDFIGALSK